MSCKYIEKYDKANNRIITTCYSTTDGNVIDCSECNDCKIDVIAVEQKYDYIDGFYVGDVLWALGESCNGFPVYYNTQNEQIVVYDATLVDDWVVATGHYLCGVEAGQILNIPLPFDPTIIPITEKYCVAIQEIKEQNCCVEAETYRFVIEKTNSSLLIPYTIGGQLRTECPTVFNQRWCRYFWELGVDNSYTSYKDTNASITFETNLGNFLTGSIPNGVGGWTNQVNAIVNIITNVFPDAQQATTYCQLPNTGSPAQGCAALPTPSVYLPKMKYRYAGFKICPGSEYPVKAIYNSDQRQEVLLDLDYQLTPAEYFDRCYSCDEIGTWKSLTDGEIYTTLPTCAVPNCADYPTIPAEDCTSALDTGCIFDEDNNLLVNTVTRLYKNCGGQEQFQYVTNFGADTQEEVDFTALPANWKWANCDGSDVPTPTPEPTCCPIAIERCACVDGVKTTIQLGWYADTGADNGVYVNADTGKQLKGVPEWISCLCEFSCTPILYSQCFIGFDYYELADFDPNDDTINWEINVDGNITNSSDDVNTQNNGNKSSWYQNLQTAVNATAWSMSVQTDANSVGTSDKPQWLFEGPIGSTLTLNRLSGTDDILTMTVNADGTITTTFENTNGDSICSDCLC